MKRYSDAMLRCFVCSTLTFAMATAAPARAQSGGMLDPAMDAPGEPFSYFRHPNDTIGAPFAPVATEVTPEGYLYTGFGELIFFVGNPIEPVNKRIKTKRARSVAFNPRAPAEIPQIFRKSRRDIFIFLPSEF